MREYYTDYWRSVLTINDLKTFDTIWSLKVEWFEEPNIRRGGWSGVVRFGLTTPKENINVFIKRQENHISKTFFHPLKGIATFQKEFNNILRLTNKNIPTLELIYFGQKNQQAILITKELDKYQALDSMNINQLAKQQRQDLLSKIAHASALMHRWHFQHNCFYPKHIFVKHIDGQWDVKFIDLEKLKRTILRKHAVTRDLSTLSRHADKHWTLKDRIHFFKAYVGENTLSKQSKKLWHTIANKIDAKRK